MVERCKSYQCMWCLSVCLLWWSDISPPNLCGISAFALCGRVILVLPAFAYCGEMIALVFHCTSACGISLLVFVCSGGMIMLINVVMAAREASLCLLHVQLLGDL